MQPPAARVDRGRSSDVLAVDLHRSPGIDVYTKTVIRLVPMGNGGFVAEPMT